MPNAERLKKRIAERGYSQRSLAATLGIAQPTLSQKINGSRPFSLQEADHLAKLLEIPPSQFRTYFLGGNLHSAKMKGGEHERIDPI